MPPKTAFTPLRTLVLTASAAATLLTTAAAPAAQRTFVASSGNDANPCTLAQPCRSFGAAMPHTDADGEILVLDSAGYGPVIVDRSVAISAPAGVHAGISIAAGGTAVVVQGPAGNVFLRGLTINGQETNSTGISIAPSVLAKVHIERCVISNVSTAIAVTAQAWVFVENSAVQQTGGVVAENVAAILSIDRTRFERSSGSAIKIRNGPSLAVSNSVLASTNGDAVAVIGDDGTSTTAASVSDSQIYSNNHGVFAWASVGGSMVQIDIARSTISDSFTAFYASASAGSVSATISQSLIARSSGGAILASGTGVAMTLTGSTVSHSSGGVAASDGAVIRTLQNNAIRENSGFDTFGLTPVPGN